MSTLRSCSLEGDANTAACDLAVIHERDTWPIIQLVLTIKTTSAWQAIVDGTILSQSEAGTLYLVPNLGQVWVGPDNFRESMTAEAEFQCDLIACNDGLTEKRVWAIVNFRLPVKLTISLCQDSSEARHQ